MRSKSITKPPLLSEIYSARVRHSDVYNSPAAAVIPAADPGGSWGSDKPPPVYRGSPVALVRPILKN